MKILTDKIKKSEILKNAQNIHEYGDNIKIVNGWIENA